MVVQHPCAKVARSTPRRCRCCRARIAVPYSGNMSLLLATGSNVTVPVQGTYTGSTYAPAVRTPPSAVEATLLFLIAQQSEPWRSLSA